MATVVQCPELEVRTVYIPENGGPANDWNRRALHFAPPDFLLNLVGSASFMRLSLRKAAHPALSTAAQQEIRVRSGPSVENHFLTG
jgi:hypothetical protein